MLPFDKNKCAYGYKEKHMGGNIMEIFLKTIKFFIYNFWGKFAYVMKCIKPSSYIIIKSTNTWEFNRKSESDLLWINVLQAY